MQISNIITALGAACLALVFIESGVPHWIKVRIWGRDAYRHRLKPFDCHLCLAWWLGIAINFFGTKSAFSIYTCVQSALTGAIASIVAVLLHKHLSK